MDREFEADASRVLERLCEKRQDTSYELLTRQLSSWSDQDLFSLAGDTEGVDFVKNNCCQTYLDTTWVGKTTKSTSLCANIKVSVNMQ